jgi:ATP-dependent DNA helicase RecG
MSKSISELIKEAENQFIELKEQFSEGVLKTISAFANTSGGVILIGVNDDKEVVGVNLKVGEFEDIINKIENAIGFHPEIKVVQFKGKELIRIDVKKSSIPIKYKGIYYKRVGNTTKAVPKLTFSDSLKSCGEGKRSTYYEVLSQKMQK